MTVRVGEMSSEVEVQAGAAGGADGGGGGGPPAGPPGWAERERHRIVAETEVCDRARLAGEGFDG